MGIVRPARRMSNGWHGMLGHVGWYASGKSEVERRVRAGCIDEPRDCEGSGRCPDVHPPAHSAGHAKTILFVGALSRSWRPPRRYAWWRARRQRPGHHKVPFAAMRAEAPLDLPHPLHERVDRLDHRGIGCRYRECDTRQCQSLGLVRGRQQAVVADAFEPGWQHVHQEPVDKFDGVEPDRALPTAGRIRPHPERYLVVVDADDALVRDRYPVRIAAQMIFTVAPAKAGAQFSMYRSPDKIGPWPSPWRQT